MQYVTKLWRTVQAERGEEVSELRPACPGAFEQGTDGCTARPNHVVTWTDNGSGLPGCGALHVTYVCYRHLHRVIKFGELLARFVTVSTYDGI